MNHETCKQKAKDLETQIQEVVAELQASGLYDARSLAGGGFRLTQVCSAMAGRGGAFNTTLSPSSMVGYKI